MNPEGLNQRKHDAEAWRIALHLIEAIDCAPTEERRAELMETYVRHVCDGAVIGNPKVLVALLERLWPLP